MEVKSTEAQFVLKFINQTNRSVFLTGKAGTGKTTVITERIRYLISEKNIKPDEILALTFTEKFPVFCAA